MTVSDAVFEHISQGNQARDAKQWPEACAAYEDSLKLDPDLAHIWIQLGHAEKERGDLARAEQAYVQAAIRQSSSTESFIHLGHMRKDAGDLRGAARYLLSAARREPQVEDVVAELQYLLAQVGPKRRVDLARVLSSDLYQKLGEANLASAPRAKIFIDISPAIAQILNERQLTQAQTDVAKKVLHLLEKRPGSQLCAHVNGYPTWLQIARSQLQNIIVASSKPAADLDEFDGAAALLSLELIFARPLEFLPGDRLLTDATPDELPDHDYFFDLAIKAGAGIAHLEDVESPSSSSDTRTPLSTDRPDAFVVPAGRSIGFGEGCEGLRLRRGPGWLTPSTWGSWTYAGGVEFGIALPSKKRWRLALELKGLPDCASRFEIAVSTGERLQATIARDETRWIAIVIDEGCEPMVRVKLHGQDACPVEDPSTGQRMLASIGIAGIHLCAEDDRAERLALLEAITFGKMAWH